MAGAGLAGADRGEGGVESGCGGASIICQPETRDRANVELLTIAVESGIHGGDSFVHKVMGRRRITHEPTRHGYGRRNPRTEPIVTTRGPETEALRHLP